MTRADLRARILAAVNEDPDDPVFWSAAQINRVIDEAREVLAEEAGATIRTAFLALEAGRTTYRLTAVAPDMMAPTRCWLVSPERRLGVASLADLDRHSEVWRDTSGEPRVWAPVSWDTLAVYPRGAGVLRVDYLAWPRPLLDDDDRPEGPEADTEAIVRYGQYDGELKRWSPKAAADCWAAFLGQWDDSRARVGVRRGVVPTPRGEAETGMGSWGLTR